jgi:hypothetical protein
MLQQSLHIIIVSVVCVVWGTPLLLAFKNSIDKDSFWYRSYASMLSFVFFAGCIVISFISSWAGLVTALNFSYLLLCTIAPVSYLFFLTRKKIIEVFNQPFGKTYFFKWSHFFFIIVSIGLFLFLSSLQPVNRDTAIYHLQVIRWQYEYGAVPGVANLYPRLGLNSNWLNLISLFYIPKFKNENFTYLNSAFVIWFFIWLFSAWNFHLKQMRIEKNSRVLCLFYFLLILYGLYDWQLFRDAANSTNFDFPVNAFFIIIFSFFIERIFNNDVRNDLSVLILIFSFALIGFKFSGIFVCLLIAYHLFRVNRFSKWLLAACTALLFLIPLFLRNYITSGYPFFPSTFTMATPDWQLPKEIADNFYRYIVLSNKFYNYRWPFINNFHITTFNWIPFWIKGILLIHRIILLLSFLLILFLFIKPKLSLDYKKLRHLIVLLCLMIAGWFFTAPDPGRFGYGMLLVSAFLFVSLVAHNFFNHKIYTGLLIITSLITCYYIYKKSNQLNVVRYWAKPISIPEPAYSTIKISQVELHLPDKTASNPEGHCHFTNLPCIHQQNPYLQPRGNSIREGFKMDAIRDSNFILNYNY